MEERRTCTHYSAFTLWWTKEEGETLTCPPDFTRNCCEDDAMLLEEEEEYYEEVDTEMDSFLESTEHLEQLEHEIHQSEIRQALLDVHRLLVEDSADFCINGA